VRDVTSPQAIFLPFCLLGGLALGLLMPPFGNPDEQVHLARAYMISEGDLLPPTESPDSRATFPQSLVLLDRSLPRSIAGQPPQKLRRADVLALLAQPLRPNVRVRALALSYYTPAVYLHLAAAIGVARLFEPAPLVLLYAGRLANLALYAGLGWLALGLAPACRWPLLLLLLLPMAVSQAASVSGDAPTLAASVLFAALVCRAIYGEGEHVDAATRRGLAASGATLGLVKPGYWLVGALALAVPAERFPDRASRLRLLAAVAAAVLAPYALWGLVLAAHASSPIHPPADPAAQLAQMARAPFGYAAVLARTLGAGLATYVESFVGLLGRLNVHLPPPLWALAPLALVGAALAEPAAPRGPSPRARAALAALFVAGVILVSTLAYVSVNPPGAPFVAGVQGRYFLPLAPIALLAVPPLGSREPRHERARAAGAALFAAVLLAAAVDAVWRAFYAGA
jgi:uncharacterized membrane protein